MPEQKDFEPMMTEEEILIITPITKADAPYSERAQALLAVNAGKTQEAAGEAAGLRATQVKYWVARYRKSGLAIFPDELLAGEVEEEVFEGLKETIELEAAEALVAETAVSLEKSVSSSDEQAPSEQKDQVKKKKKKGERDKPKEAKAKKSVAITEDQAKPDKKSKKKKKKKKDNKTKSKKKGKVKSKKKKKDKKSDKPKKAKKSKKQKKAKSKKN